MGPCRMAPPLQSSERQWEFWECKAKGNDVVRLTIKINGRPIAHGALNWLLRAAGAGRTVIED